MRAVIQRVKNAQVKVEDQIIGAIHQGLLILLGIHVQDSPENTQLLIDRIIHLRIFADEQGKMNRSLLDVQGEILVVSQFTLYADSKKGRRPSFLEAAPPDKAQFIYEKFVQELRNHVQKVETGSFGAYMQVSLTNDGPVTLILDV